jgi:acetylornithine deacetylase/succinyl-diaminopimelate desuccinylase-like protein
MTLIEPSLDYANDHFDNFIEDVVELVSFATVSSDRCSRRAMNSAVDWLGRRLRKASLDKVNVFETSGNPILVASTGIHMNDAPTILIYGHYDVVPAGPTEAWKHDPYTATVDGEYLCGRGTSDMKAQLLACIEAVEAAGLGETPPINAKFLIEGNEETGPGEVIRFIKANSELLQCDFSLNCDAGMLGPLQPTIVYGLRGRMGCRISVTGPSQVVHEGSFGGTIGNPIHVLSELIAGLHDTEGRISLPGFYDSVTPLSDEERSALAKLPLDDQFYLDSSGVPELWGDKSYQPIERVGARPSLNVMRIRAGDEEASGIPAQAEALVSIRLVPHQLPLVVFEQLSRYVRDNSPSHVTCRVDYLGGAVPCLVDRSSPAVEAIAGALEDTWRVKPLFNRIGGTIPVVASLQEQLGVESVLTGFGLPGDGIHGPNERVHLPTLKRGIEALIRFFNRLSG